MTSPAHHLARGPEAASAAGRAFANIMEAWRIDEAEAVSLAGLASVSTLHAWRRGDVTSLTEEQLTRVSYVLGIYKALQLVFLDGQVADAWVSKQNDAFGGSSAKKCMLDRGVGGMAQVRQYLDHVRGGRS